MTLDELIEAFNALTERENRQMEFSAKLAGAELKGDKQTKTKQTDTNTPTLADKLRARRQSEQEAGGGKAPKEFSHGVGYQVIGG